MTGDRRKLGITAFLPSCLVYLTFLGCTFTVERAELRVSEDLNVDVSGTLFAPAVLSITDSDISDMERCSGTSIRRRAEEDRIFYSLSRSSLSPGEFRDFQECLIVGEWATPRLRRVDGYLYNTYVMTLPLFESSPVLGREHEFNLRYLPRVLNISMPGTNISIEDVSQRPVAEITINRISSADADIFLSIPDTILREAGIEAKGLCPRHHSICEARNQASREGQWPAIVPVTLEIKSIEYKYGISEIIAVFALLF